MRLSTQALSRYRRGIEGLSEQAATELVSLLEAYAERYPTATPEDIRRFTIRAAEQVLGTYGDGSSMLAATLYDEIMEREGAGVASAAIYGGPDAGRTEGTVRRLAGRLVGDDPDWDGYLAQAANFVRDGVRRAARDTVTENVRRDRRTKGGRRIAYARVPTRANPCPYCAMLASRGFTYASEDTAEAGSHHNCTCIIVPGIKGRTAVEGYDPDEWEQYWRNPPANVGANGPSQLPDPWTAKHNVTMNVETLDLPDGNGCVARTAQCSVYTTADGIRVVFPDGMDPADQPMTPERAIELLERVPAEVRKQMQREVLFVDYENAADPYWRKVYKRFTQSYATGGDSIVFYRYPHHDDDYVVRTYCHEAGHYIDRSHGSLGDLSASKDWGDAISADNALARKKSPTAYGENSRSEDFAESVAEWATSSSRFRVEFPNRTRILDHILM